MTLMLVYCDDPPSHTANPLSLYITDPNPIVPKDVYIALTRDPGFGNSGNSTARLRGKRGDRNLLWARNEGQVREVRDAGTVLPPKATRRTRPGQRLPDPPIHETREKWSPRCRWCGQRGGRWKADDRDEVFSQLAQRGITGVSPTALGGVPGACAAPATRHAVPHRTVT